MPYWLEAAIAGVIGLGLIGGVFWFAFAPSPSRRSDGGLQNDDAVQLTSHFTSGDHAP